jgi:peptide/nickel transport system permease protein
MTTGLIRLLATTSAVLAVLVVATFLMVQLAPGDAAQRIGGIDATPEQLDQIRRDFRLDQPMAARFVAYVGGLMQGDLGISYATREPVARIIADRMGNTLWLAVTSVAIMAFVAVPLGLIVGGLTWGDRNRGLDIGFVAGTSIAASLPGLLVATLLAYVFAVLLRWLPVAGATQWTSVILPACAIALRPMSELARMIRVETLNVLSQDYVRTARAKRMTPVRLYTVHILPNVLTAALTLTGLVFAHLIGGAVVIENIFAWPGLGTALVQAVMNRDFPVIQGIVLMLGLVIILVNATVDAALIAIDPRVARK